MSGLAAGERNEDLTEKEPGAVAAPLAPVSVGEATRDLTETEPGAAAAPFAPVGVGKPTIDDWTRLALAGSLIGLLSILTLGTGWFVANYPAKEMAIEAFLKLVFTPVIGLAGSAVGFYFGSRTGTNGSDH